MNNKILLIHENKKLGDNLSEYFIHNHLILFHALDIDSGLEIVEDIPLDLILFDTLSTQRNIFENYQLIRQKVNAPIIVITARDQSDDQIINRITNSDDYIYSPFQPKELLIKIITALDHSYINFDNHETNQKNVLSFHNLEIDPKLGIVKLLNEDLKLSKTEFQLLYFLASNPLKTFTQHQILNKVKGRKIYLISLSLDLAIYNLKRKLKPLDYIKTVWGSGYSFVPHYEPL